MKKSLIALAVLGAVSGAASAQSNVTMYGIVDVGVNYLERGVNIGTTAAPVYSQESNWAIDSGLQSGSRLGVRGSEALGRNWSAIFDLEMGFDVSTGTSLQGGRLFGRQAYAGLRHSAAGSFVLGRIATPSSGTGDFDLFGDVDPFGTGFSQLGLQATFIPSSTLREDNSFAWASPVWAGFKFGAQYSANVDTGETAPNSTNTEAYNLGANWTWGPLFLAATYDVISFAESGRVNAGNPDQKMLQVGGVFDFKFLKVHAAYADQDDISAVIVGTGGIGSLLPAGIIPVGVGNYNNQAYMVGLTIPLVGGSLFGSYQWSDAKNIDTTAFSFEPDYNVWGVGYTYPFSRRTNFYAAYGQRKWDGNITNVVVPVTGALANAAQVVDLKQFMLGIRHLF